jgi:hypothetical protein
MLTHFNTLVLKKCTEYNHFAVHSFLCLNKYVLHRIMCSKTQQKSMFTKDLVIKLWYTEGVYRRFVF